MDSAELAVSGQDVWPAHPKHNILRTARALVTSVAWSLSGYCEGCDGLPSVVAVRLRAAAIKLRASLTIDRTVPWSSRARNLGAIATGAAAALVLTVAPANAGYQLMQDANWNDGAAPGSLQLPIATVENAVVPLAHAYDNGYALYNPIISPQYEGAAVGSGIGAIGTTGVTSDADATSSVDAADATSVTSAVDVVDATSAISAVDATDATSATSFFDATDATSDADAVGAVGAIGTAGATSNTSSVDATGATSDTSSADATNAIGTAGTTSATSFFAATNETRDPSSFGATNATSAIGATGATNATNAVRTTNATNAAKVRAAGSIAATDGDIKGFAVPMKKMAGYERGTPIAENNGAEEPLLAIRVTITQLPSTESAGAYTWPANGTLFSRFGSRDAQLGSTNHKGIDISGHLGDPIYAADGGEVIVSERSRSYGNMIHIRHDNGQVTLYAHCSELLVGVGERVAQGQQIALMGRTGLASGMHLHFEIIIDGENVDPLKYLAH